MQIRTRRKWENDGVQWWVVAVLGGIWLLTVIGAALASTGNSVFAYNRVADTAVLVHYANKNVPELVSELASITDSDLAEGLAEQFDQSLESDPVPELSLPRWALAFHVLGDDARAEQALGLVDSGRGGRQAALVRSIIHGEEPSPETLIWLRERIDDDSWELPEWHYSGYIQNDEAVADWLVERGSRLIRRGLAAHVLLIFVVIAIVISMIWFVVKRKAYPQQGHAFRLCGRWRQLHLLREFLFAEMLAGLCAFVFSFPAFLMGSADIGTVIAGAAIMIVPPIWLILRLTPGFRASFRLLGMKRPHWDRGALVALGLCGIGGIGIVLTAITYFSDSGGSLEDSLDPGLLDRPLAVAWIFIVAVVLAPFSEEIVFRGFLFGGLARKWGAIWAAIVSSLVFAAMHGYSLTGFLVVTVYGLVFCWLYQRSGSLWPGIVAHAVINLVITAEVTGWHSLH